MKKSFLSHSRPSHISRFKILPSSFRVFRVLCGLPLCALCVCAGCQVLTYESAVGEKFTRSSFGSKTAIASLSVEATTNGVRRVELRGYHQDSTEALGVITDAAVRAAISAAKP